MAIPHWSMTALVLVISACSARRAATASDFLTPYPLRDTTLFAAVISSIPAVHVRGGMEIDPRPLRPSEDADYPVDQHYAMADSTVVAARLASIEGLGLRSTADMSAGSCTGYMLGTPPAGSCPEAPVTRLAVGLPRPVPDNRVPAWRRAGAVAGRKADAVVRVVALSLGPGGSGVSIEDYYMAKEGTEWLFVARRVIGNLH